MPAREMWIVSFPFFSIADGTKWHPVKFAVCASLAVKRRRNLQLCHNRRPSLRHSNATYLYGQYKAPPVPRVWRQPSFWIIFRRRLWRLWWLKKATSPQGARDECFKIYIPLYEWLLACYHVQLANIADNPKVVLFSTRNRTLILARLFYLFRFGNSKDGIFAR